MTPRGWLAALTLVALAGAAAAHPHRYVDQQAGISLGRERARLTIRIVPSLQEGAAIFAHIDTDGSGTVSPGEAAAFGADVVSRAWLEVDGRKVSFAPAAASVPGKELVAAGSGVIEITAAADFALAERDGHALVFDIAYEDFSHDWFVQPFFYPDLAAPSAPVVERHDGSSRITVRFSSP